jgi:hypothetical protein
MTVRAFPCYLTRVPEKAKNGGNCARELSEKGNRAGYTTELFQAGLRGARDISWYDKGRDAGASVA